MKKKVISALLASTMIVSLVACGSTGGDSSDASSKGSGTTATSTAGGDDVATAESGSGSGDSAASADWIESSTLEDDAVPGENDDRAFEKFDHVVEVHYGYQIDPKDTTLPDGDSVDNNQYTRYLLDNYNIKVVCAKESAQFQIVIAAGGDIELGVVIVAVSTIAEWIELSDIFSAGIGQTGLFSPYLKRALPLLEI